MTGVAEGNQGRVGVRVSAVMDDERHRGITDTAGVACAGLLVAILAVFTMLSAHFNSMEARIDARIDALVTRVDSRLTSIEEHLRAAPAPAFPENP